MRRPTSNLWLPFALSLFCTAPVWAQAEEGAARADARRIGYSGIEAYQRGDYAAAEAQLSRAYQLLPAPSLGLWSARALAKTGKWLEAAARYQEVGRLPVETGDAEVQRQAQAQAAEERATLLPSIPRLALRVLGAGWRDVELRIDGKPFDGKPFDGKPAPNPILLNPGVHVISARRGKDELHTSATLAAGSTESALLSFPDSSGERPPAPALAAGESPPPSPRTSLRPYAYASWGIGVLGFAAFGMASSLSKVDRRAFERECTGVTSNPEFVGPGVCLDSALDAKRSRFEREGVWADVGLLTGVGGAAAGTLLWLLSPSVETAASERLGAGLTLGALAVTGLTSSALFALSSASQHDALSVCKPYCSSAQTRSADRRGTLAALSLGLGVLALGGATWLLLSESSTSNESAAVEVSLSGAPGGATLHAAGSF